VTAAARNRTGRLLPTPRPPRTAAIFIGFQESDAATIRRGNPQTVPHRDRLTEFFIASVRARNRLLLCDEGPAREVVHRNISVKAGVFCGSEQADTASGSRR